MRLWDKLKPKLKKALRVVLNPRALLCFGLAWIVTNGWAYIALALGTLLSVEWLQWVAGVYLSLLWFPFTPEKLITVCLSLLLLRWFFPNDKETLGVLRELHRNARRRAKERSALRRARRGAVPSGENE